MVLSKKAWFVSFALALAAIAPAHADDSVTVTQAWARATPGTVKTGAIYLTATNNGMAADRLVGASSPAADKVELHEMAMDNGVMKMRPVKSLTIAPGKSVVLKPGGYHVMLTGLKAPLKEGDTVPLTLRFEKAGAIAVTAQIAKAGAMHPGEMSGMPAKPGMSGGSGGMSMPGMH